MANCFIQVRRLDASAPGGMDTYAYLLYGNCNRIEGKAPEDITRHEEELSLLANAMLNECPRLAVGWVAAALYTDLKEDKEKSLAFIEKVCLVCDDTTTLLPYPDFHRTSPML